MDRKTNFQPIRTIVMIYRTKGHVTARTQTLSIRCPCCFIDVQDFTALSC